MPGDAVKEIERFARVQGVRMQRNSRAEPDLRLFRGPLEMDASSFHETVLALSMALPAYPGVYIA
jgi:hypothetical protein